jgi:hypothetical protein
MVVVKKIKNSAISALLGASVISSILFLGAGTANLVERERLGDDLEELRDVVRYSEYYKLYKSREEEDSWYRYKKGEISIDELKESLEDINNLSYDKIANDYLDCLNIYQQEEYLETLPRYKKTLDNIVGCGVVSGSSIATMIVTSYILDKKQNKNESESEIEMAE